MKDGQNRLGDYRKALFNAMHSGHIPDVWILLVRKTRIGRGTFRFLLILNDYVRFSRPGRYFLQVQDLGVTSANTQLGVIPSTLR